MAEIVNEIARRRGADAALTDEVGATSWQELDHRINRLVHALRDAGIRAGETFAVLSGTVGRCSSCSSQQVRDPYWEGQGRSI